MSYSFIGYNTNYTSGSDETSIGVSYSPTVGNLVIIVAQFFSSVSSYTFSLADSNDNAWNNPYGYFSSDNDDHLYVWYSIITVGGSDTFTATVEGTGTPAGTDLGITVLEYSGIVSPYFTSGQSSMDDQAASSPGTGANAVTSGDISTLTTAPYMLFGFSMDTNQAGTFTPGTGFTSRGTFWEGWGIVEDMLYDSVSAVAATFTASVSSVQPVSFALAFNTSGSGPPPPSAGPCPFSQTQFYSQDHLVHN